MFWKKKTGQYVVGQTTHLEQLQFGIEEKTIMESQQIFEGGDTFWDLMNGKNLFKANGSVHKANVVLAGKKINLLYFSANWCQDCSEFTPVLASFYQVIFHNAIDHAWFQPKKERFIPIKI